MPSRCSQKIRQRVMHRQGVHQNLDERNDRQGQVLLLSQGPLWYARFGFWHVPYGMSLMVWPLRHVRYGMPITICPLRCVHYDMSVTVCPLRYVRYDMSVMVLL